VCCQGVITSCGNLHDCSSTKSGEPTSVHPGQSGDLTSVRPGQSGDPTSVQPEQSGDPTSVQPGDVQPTPDMTVRLNQTTV
jgi:hypothetical protein